jgi:hypothetical protein
MILTTASLAAQFAVEPFLTKPHLGRPFPYLKGIAWLANDAPLAARKAKAFLTSIQQVIDYLNEDPASQRAQTALLQCGLLAADMIVFADTGVTTEDVVRYYGENKRVNANRARPQITPKLAHTAETRILELISKGIPKSKAESRVASELFREGIGPDVTPDAYRKAITKLNSCPAYKSLLELIATKVLLDRSS